MTNIPAAALLWNDLPQRDHPLDAEAAALLASLPDYADRESVQAIDLNDEAACRRLEKRGLVKVHRWKDDPIAIRPTMYAGRVS